MEHEQQGICDFPGLPLIVFNKMEIIRKKNVILRKEIHLLKFRNLFVNIQKVIYKKCIYFLTGDKNSNSLKKFKNSLIILQYIKTIVRIELNRIQWSISHFEFVDL